MQNYQRGITSVVSKIVQYVVCSKICGKTFWGICYRLLVSPWNSPVETYPPMWWNLEVGPSGGDWVMRGEPPWMGWVTLQETRRAALPLPPGEGEAICEPGSGLTVWQPLRLGLLGLQDCEREISVVYKLHSLWYICSSSLNKGTSQQPQSLPFQLLFHMHLKNLRPTNTRCVRH